MEENTVFEINDFTIVTDMEHFGAAFEGIIQKYDLYGRRPCLPHDVNYRLAVSETSTVSIGEDKLRVELMQPTILLNKSRETIKDELEEDDDDSLTSSFTAADEIGNFRNGFESENSLTLKFGIRECIVISPADNNSILIYENQANTIIGTIKTIIHSCKSEIPVFCVLKEQPVNMIQGYASDGNTSYNFSTVVLRNINRRHCYLSDLLYLFKEHLGVSTSAFHDEVRISSRFTHVAEFDVFDYCRLPTVKSLTKLATGPVSHLPFNAVEIAATWSFFRENSLTENYSHSDFDINHSSYWAVQFKPDPRSLTGIFDEILGIYTEDRKKAIRSDIKCETILGKHHVHKTVPNAFQRLTVSSTSEVKIGDSKNHSDEENANGPISKSMIRAWIDFILDEPLASDKLAHELNLANAVTMSEKKWQNDTLLINEKLEKLFEAEDSRMLENFSTTYKAAKKNTTAWRLAVALANARVLMSQEPRAEPQLWVEFLIQLRKKYERMENVEKASSGIDHTQCAFSQKLQMIQLCIEARRKREQSMYTVDTAPTDEFFDADETFNTENKSDKITDGRLKLAGMMLIGKADTPMYIPVTQEACPLTDEMIDARNEHLFSLTEKERVDVQMELVRSDMQSFKAANPDAIFADFLRWHSPKDYDEKTSSISERMMIPDNIWVTTWNEAAAVPAMNQKRIFNDAKIAEEIFEFFENGTLDDVRDWMKPTTHVATLERLIETEAAYGLSEEKMKQLSKMTKLLAKATLSQSSSEYSEVFQYCSQVEMIHNMKVHLVHLFEQAKEKMHPPYPTQNEISDVTKQLINLAIEQLWETSAEKKEVCIVKPQDPVGRALAKIGHLDEITEKQRINGKRKEYIFIWNLKRPSTTTLSMTHRMYADLSCDKHSLHFSIANDSNFSDASYI